MDPWPIGKDVAAALLLGADRLIYYFHQSYRDYLSKCLNRRGLFTIGAAAIFIRKQYAVLFIDIDHFKRINDEVDHGAGDRVLQELGAVLRRIIPPGSCVARLGGEEFIILLPGFSEEEAWQFARIIRRYIATHRFNLNDGRRVTASIGISTAPRGTPLDEPIKRADKAMYQAKQTGRNRVCLFPDGGAAFSPSRSRIRENSRPPPSPTRGIVNVSKKVSRRVWSGSSLHVATLTVELALDYARKVLWTPRARRVLRRIRSGRHPPS